MRADTQLNTIREKLFYGLPDYTKSFPDFSVPQRFLMASPKRATEMLETIRTSLSDDRQILLYIHMPFCSSECAFCNAFPNETNPALQAKYVESLLAESEMYARAGIFAGKKVKSVYFGGGTPTVFPNQALARILSNIRSLVDLSDDCNISLEAHPSHLANNDRIEELSDLGIDRLSVGCQTFDVRVLKLCRRSNPESQLREVVRHAQKVGLAINVDMMIGLPGQTLGSVATDLDILSQLAPDSIEYMRHEVVNPLVISMYRKNPELLVDIDELFSMVQKTQEWIESTGYEQNGHFRDESHFPYRYYWLKEIPFIALGSRSRSYTKTLCYDKHADPSLYMQLLDNGVFPVARYMALNKRDQMYRSLLLNLQIRSGLDPVAFSSRFGEDAHEVFAILLKHLADFGCVVADPASIRLRKYGRYFVEDVCCFIIDHALREAQHPANLKRLPHSSGPLFKSGRGFSNLQQ